MICDIHKELYRIYHGDVFTIDPELKYEWARIPISIVLSMFFSIQRDFCSYKPY